MSVRLIESYDLPYLEPLHHLPATMVRHLTKHNVQALSPAVSSTFTLCATRMRNKMAQHAPTALFLHSLTARVARRMLGSYKIYTPELNAAPILWPVVRALARYPEHYAPLTHLSQYNLQ